MFVLLRSTSFALGTCGGMTGSHDKGECRSTRAKYREGGVAKYGGAEEVVRAEWSVRAG